MVDEETVQDGTWYKDAMERESEFDGDDLWKAEDDSKERITLLDDPDLKETSDGRDIAVFPIEVGDGEKRAWIVNRKYGDKAPFMQIAKIVTRRGGIPKDIGLGLTVVVTGKGQSRQYTILDTDDL